jgi:hypothetical protein
MLQHRYTYSYWAVSAFMFYLNMKLPMHNELRKFLAIYFGYIKVNFHFFSNGSTALFWALASYFSF